MQSLRARTIKTAEEFVHDSSNYVNDKVFIPKQVFNCVETD